MNNITKISYNLQKLASKETNSVELRRQMSTLLPKILNPDNPDNITNNNIENVKNIIAIGRQLVSLSKIITINPQLADNIESIGLALQGLQ